MKKIITTLVLSISLSISIKSYAISNDINNHWAKSQIINIENQNIMFSINNKFRPDDFITRAEFMNAINNNFGYTKTSNTNFTDVYRDSWYYNDIMKAVSAGYINGYDDGSIKPNGSITREEAAKIITLACNFDKELPQSIHRFSDSNQISDWAILYVNLLNEKGYMSGYDDGHFKPKKKLTRGETAALLYNINNLKSSTHYDIINNFISYGYSVQVGTFSNFKPAKDLKIYLNNYGFDDVLIVQFSDSKNYSVLCSSLLTIDEAHKIKSSLKNINVDSFIVDKKFTEVNIIKDFLGNESKEYKTSNNKISTIPVSGDFSVQGGIFSTIESAVQLKNSLHKSGFKDAYIIKFNNNNNYFVMVKSNVSKQEGNTILKSLKLLNFEGFITNKNIKNGIKI